MQLRVQPNGRLGAENRAAHGQLRPVAYLEFRPGSSHSEIGRWLANSQFNSTDQRNSARYIILEIEERRGGQVW